MGNTASASKAGTLAGRQGQTAITLSLSTSSEHPGVRARHSPQVCSPIKEEESPLLNRYRRGSAWFSERRSVRRVRGRTSEHQKTPVRTQAAQA